MSGIQIDIAQAMAVLGNYFDAQFYTQRYPDIDARQVNPLEHYIAFGWREGRDPCAWFSTRRYLSFHTDVTAADVDPFLHYVLMGKGEGRRIWPADFKGRLDLDIDPSSTFVSDRALRDLITFAPQPLRPPRRALRADRLSLHWLVPDFRIGSGGHMTIFRLIRWLEIAGHLSTVWLVNPDQHQAASTFYDDVVKHFQTIGARVELADSGFAKASGDAVIATGWETVARASNARGFRQRFYLVQDYEPLFYPAGSYNLAAAWTYTQDFGCICASPWLARTLEATHKRWARHFWLAYDKAIYRPTTTRRRGKRIAVKAPRIAVYARKGTPRRAVELVLLALEHLAKQGVAFHVDLFGEESVEGRAPFPCSSHGVLDAYQLANLYREATLGICFSATNYSLVPQEMMACGLPVVELDSPSTRTIFPDGVVSRARPHPLAIATEIKALLTDHERRARQAEASLRWVAQFDWEKSARDVECAILERLHPKRKRLKITEKRPKPHLKRLKADFVKVSVCIPTHNGGQLLRAVVRQVCTQRTPWPFEMIIMDSSSSDGSLDRLTSTRGPPLRIETIAKADFQHGRTRNLCIELSEGEFVAFLTQDALPADEFWLYNIVTTLGHFPNAAGAFGRHIPRQNANPFTKRDINAHFEGLLNYPLALSRDTDRDRWEAGDPEWRQLLHYYSDNNSCLRKSVWTMYPYPEIEYGEDQVWASTVIEKGYEKVYTPSASVYHSHDYTVNEVAQRAETEARFFARHFGYRLYDFGLGFNEQLAQMDNEDRRWAMANNVAEWVLERRLLENRARLYGLGRGLSDHSRTAEVPGMALEAREGSEMRL